MAHWLRICDASRLLDPGAGIDRQGDVWIRAGRIAALGAPAPGPRPGDTVDTIAACGALVTPMFIDLHVHLREPGHEEAETIATGTAAALRGGYAVVFAMPNTVPTCDEPARVEFVLAAARAAGPVEVVPVSALSRGLRGRDLVDLDAMAAAGAGAFSDDGAWLADERLAREALRWAGRAGQVVMQHCEDFGVTGPGVLHACDCVHRAGLPGIPREAEDRAVTRDVRLAEAVDGRLHVCHVSTAGAVQALRRARERGLPVSGEVTPHHLVLTAQQAVAGGPDYKMKPPLREAEDLEALCGGLADGTLQAIATDHAPHTDARKAAGLGGAPFGAIGMETAFAAVFTHLVEPGRLALARLVEALTSGPAALVGRAPPTLAVGAPARLNLIDLTEARTVDRARFASRSHNCPFHGMRLRGWPLASAVGEAWIDHGVAPLVRNRTTWGNGPPPGAGPGPVHSR